MNIQNYIKILAEELSSLYEKEHSLIVAWWLIESVTGKNKVQLLCSKNLLTDFHKIILARHIKELVHDHKPLQYILGDVHFGPLTITVAPPTLIPRPETEEWVANLIQDLAAVKEKNITILDMCTGTGCIGLWIAQALPQAHIYAVDIDQKALNLAQTNAQNNKITNITFIESDLFGNISKNLKFDLIVSNPPYIAYEEWLNLDQNVKNWEDKKALVAHDNGLALIEKLIKEASQFLKNNSVLNQYEISRLMIEIGHKQGDVVKDLYQKSGYKNVTLVKDFAKKDRAVKGSL